ncbi:mitochondrial fission process protein 1 isoform X1 [Leptonychotes weddellii]|uniref:Mitochondrial fission process protein 1 n=1 Tax=Leptonychotes weddellii TaxID=9713 RepID=A0A7F8RK20_LEPWE|nr:mitochondrial fission process protein 1 isoform X1 [Leptonychotes weddellii]
MNRASGRKALESKYPPHQGAHCSPPSLINSAQFKSAGPGAAAWIQMPTSPLRWMTWESDFLCYANEVGEAFRSLVPAAVVWLSYGVSSSYVLADAIDKGKKAGAIPSSEAGRSTRVTVAVVDTFVWQALASVAIPGFTINRVCAASLYILGTATRWPLSIRKWTTTALGLLVIPVIVHPIDRSVDFLLDSSLRKLYPSVEKPSSS